MRFVFFSALLFAFCPNNGKVFSSVVPGYLDFDNLPDTNFSCDGKVIGGYYADVETGCQMFHVCTIGQKGEITDIKFLCLNGTVFDQETRVCERVDEVDCSKTEGFYDLNLELYGNNAALSYHETEEDPVTIATVSSTPSSTTTTTTTTTTVTAPTTAGHLSLGLGRTPASTHYSSTPSPSVAAALLNVHSALSRDRHPHPHLTVQGGGSSGVLNPSDAFQSLKSPVEPQQFVFSSTTAKYSSPAGLSVSVHTTSPPPAAEPPQLHVVHYQPAHHIFTTPSVAIVSSTRSVSSVKGVVGKLASAVVSDGHSRVPINNFAFGINTGLNPAQYPAENATSQQLPQLTAHDPYDEYHEADDVSLDPFFRDVPRIAKQSKQVQRQKRATAKGSRGGYRPSLKALREESEEEEPSPQGSEVFLQEAEAPLLDTYFQKRPKVRTQLEEHRRRSDEGQDREESEEFLQEAAIPQRDTYFQKQPRVRARVEEPNRRSNEGPFPEGSKLLAQEVATPSVDTYFQKRPKVRTRLQESHRRSDDRPESKGSKEIPQEVTAPKVETDFQKHPTVHTQKQARVQTQPEATRRRSYEGPDSEGSNVFLQQVDAPRVDTNFQKQPRVRTPKPHSVQTLPEGGRRHDQGPNPEGSEVFLQEAVAPRVDTNFQKRPRVRTQKQPRVPTRLEEPRRRQHQGPNPEASNVFLQEAAAPPVDTYFQKRPRGNARLEEPRRRSDEGPDPEGSEVFMQEAVAPRVDANFQKRPRVRTQKPLGVQTRVEEPHRRRDEGPDRQASAVFPQETVAPRVDGNFQKRPRVRTQKPLGVQTRLEEPRRRSDEGPVPRGSSVFLQEAATPRVDTYFQKQSRGRGRHEETRRRPEQDALPTAEAFFRSTKIGQLQQTVTPVPETRDRTLATEEPVDDQTIQTTTLATEATSQYRGATQQLPYDHGNEVEGISGRRPAAGSRGSGYRSGSAASRRAGPREAACSGAGCDGQRAAYQAVLAEVSRRRPPAPSSTPAPTQQTAPAPEPATSGDAVAVAASSPAPPASRKIVMFTRRPPARSQQGDVAQRRAPSRRPSSDARTPLEPEAPYEQAATTPQPPTTLPETSFSCADKVPGGYYADVEADCQLFHICSQGRHGRITDNKFMCGPGTRFNQQSRTCQARELVDCSISTSLYHLNNHFQIMQQEDLNDEPGFEPLKVRRSKRQAKGAARSPDYTVDSLPETSFSCEDKLSEGLYADVETQCQGFHLCQKVKGVMTLVSTFVCPHKTVFNQREGNCDNWEDVDCSLYSQPEHSFARKGNRKHTHTKRDTRHIFTPLYLFSHSNGKPDTLKENISLKNHSFNSRNENNTKKTPISASPLFRYSKPLKKSNSGKELEKSNGQKSMTLDLVLDLQSTTPLSHKRIKHEATDVSNETEEEYYDYIDDSYEADLVPPEQENSNETSAKDTTTFETGYTTDSHSNKDSSDILTTHLANNSSNELLIANNNQNYTSTEGTITTLPSITSSSNSHETGVTDCAGNDTCGYKEELRHTGNEKVAVTSSNSTNTTEAPPCSAEEQLENLDCKNKTSTPHSDEYEYYDYYIEDIEDEVINYPTEQTTLSGLVHDAESSPNGNIPHTMPTSSEKSYSSTTESITSDKETADIDRNKSDAENKYHNFPAIVSEEELENTQTKHFEISSQKTFIDDNAENTKGNKSEDISVTQTQEISLEEPISAVDEKYDYYDSAPNHDGAQSHVTHKEVPNMNFATTEMSQKDVSDTKEENGMYQHNTEATNEPSIYGDVTDVSVTQVSRIKHLKQPEVAGVHEERTEHTTIPALLSQNMDMDLLSDPNVSLESGLPMVVNTTLNNQNTGSLVSEEAAQIKTSSLPEYTTTHQTLPDEDNSQFQVPLQSDRKESQINPSSENTTPHTATTQGSATLPIPNLFHPPKPHRAYHGRHSTPVLPPVVIRSKDAAYKSRVRNNRHKTKKTQHDEIHTTTESFVKSENGPVISASDNYYSTDKELIPKKDEVTSVDSEKDAANTLAISGRVNELKVEQKTEPVFQQHTITHSQESVTVMPSTETVFRQAVPENDLRVKTDDLDGCKGNADCQHVQSQYTTLSPVNYKFHDKHTDHLSHIPQNDGLLSEHTEKTLQQPNSLEQSTLRLFKGSEERSKAEEPVVETDIPPTSSGNTVDYVTITPKVQSLKDASDTVTTDSLSPTYTLSAINAQSNQKSNHDISRFVCSGKELYRYYPDPLDCRIFHYCSHGFHNQQVLDFKFMCENGTAFSTDTQKCENEEEVQSCSMTKK